MRDFLNTEPVVRYPSCRGDCDQGKRPCAENGRCFIVPAEASTDVGTEDGWLPVAGLRENLQVIYPGILALALVALFYVLATAAAPELSQLYELLTSWTR